jgi:hypothetical protein
MSISNPTPPQHKGVSVEHPTIKEYVKNMAKKGESKEHAMKVSGMPMEVVDRIYHEVKK